VTPWILDPQGPAAGTIATLGWILMGVCGVVYVLVLGALAWALGRRESPDDAATTRRLTGVVTGAVVVTTVTLVGLAASSSFFGRGLNAPTGPGAVTVDVIGHQWWWDFQYRDVSPSDVVSSPNELHIPVGVRVVLKVQSRDVIHSFWVPALHGKRDLVPGQTTRFWIQADEPGVYRGRCAEFCGHQHARMAFLVVAEPMAQFQAWLRQQRQPAAAPAGDAERHGQAVFLRSPCRSCHTIRGTDAGSRFGPELTHLASRRTIASGTLPNTVEHLERWLDDPQAIKPGVRMPPVPLARSDRDAMVAYLRSLR
jgi:cytochrome c oxidase subunit 2